MTVNFKPVDSYSSIEVCGGGKCDFKVFQPAPPCIPSIATTLRNVPFLELIAIVNRLDMVQYAQFLQSVLVVIRTAYFYNAVRPDESPLEPVCHRNRKVVISVMVVWYGAENGMHDRTGQGL